VAEPFVERLEEVEVDAGLVGRREAADDPGRAVTHGRPGARLLLLLLLRSRQLSTPQGERAPMPVAEGPVRPAA
jgi:hypothetical protein